VHLLINALARAHAFNFFVVPLPFGGRHDARPGALTPYGARRRAANAMATGVTAEDMATAKSSIICR
jgi:hypothetical protein